MSIKCVMYVGFRFILLGKSCYFFRDDLGTWQQQRDFCLSQSAHLAELETLEEMTLLGNYMTLKSGDVLWCYCTSLKMYCFIGYIKKKREELINMKLIFFK